MILKNKVKLTVFSSILLIIIFLSINYFVLVSTIYHGNRAVIAIIGDPYFEKFFGLMSLKNKKDLERQYFLYWEENTDRLGKYWNVSSFYYMREIPSLSSFSYSDLTIFFIGHGMYVPQSNKLYFMIREDKWIDVSQFSSQIHADNITTVVDSCYSAKWVNTFKPTNLTALYYSVLGISTYNINVTYYYDFKSNSFVLSEIYSYSALFVNFLLKGYNFSHANISSNALITRS